MADDHNKLGPQNPLMQMIEIGGKLYYSTHKHHHDYVTTSKDDMKYRRHADFLRRIRSIEARDIYMERGDWHELSWHEGGKITNANSALVSHINNLPPLLRLMFKANGYHPLILLNATAQLAVFEILDNELSKQTSVAKNTYVARQQDDRKPSSLYPVEAATRQLKSYLEIGAMLDTPLHITQQIAVREIKRDTGIDLTPMLIAAPAQQGVKEEHMMLEPTDLAKKLGYKDGHMVNILLGKVSWQIRLVSGEWEATPVGKLYSIPNPWFKDRKSGYNLKWKVEEVRNVFRGHGFLPEQQG